MTIYQNVKMYKRPKNEWICCGKMLCWNYEILWWKDGNIIVIQLSHYAIINITKKCVCVLIQPALGGMREQIEHQRIFLFFRIDGSNEFCVKAGKIKWHFVLTLLATSWRVSSLFTISLELQMLQTRFFWAIERCFSRDFVIALFKPRSGSLT